MHQRLRSINARQLEKALRKDGFLFIHQRGSHKMFIKNSQVVILAVHHPSDNFRRKTLKSIIHQAGWTEEYLDSLLD